MWLSAVLTAALVAQSVLPVMAAQSLNGTITEKTATASNADKAEMDGAKEAQTAVSGNYTSSLMTAALQDQVFEFAEKDVVKYVGDTNQGFKPTINGYSTTTLTYESSNPNVVAVDSSGILTVKMAGSAVITATLSREASKPTASYTVTVPERELNFTQNPVVVPLGETIELPLEMKNFSERSTARSLFYEIGDAAVLKMESQAAPGKVKGQKLGSTTLTAYTQDGMVKSTVNVIVSTDAAVSDLQVTNNFEKAVTLSWKMTGTEYYEVYRKPDGEEYTRVDSGSLESGQTTVAFTDTRAEKGASYTYKVVALAFGGLEAATQEINVTVASQSITLNSLSLYPGETVQAEPKYEGYTTVPAAQWSVDDTSIATVDNTGKVTALKAGRTKVTVRLADGNEKTANVFVTNPSEVTELKTDLNMNRHVQISWTKAAVSDTIRVYRKEGTGSWNYLTSTTGTSYVDETAQSGHTYQYKVTRIIQHNNEKYETAGVTLEVSVTNQTAEVTEKLNVVRKGQSYQIPLTLSGFAQTPVIKYTSSNTSVATVDASGKVSIKGEGRADITIEVENGPTLTCTYFCAERPSGMYTAREWQVFILTNQNRMNEGHAPLSMFPQMQKATDIRKKELVTKYSHMRPDGSSCFTAFGDVGLSYNRVAENIAMGQTTPSQVVTAWMNSSGHYKNIMGNYQHFATGETSNHWVQMFLGCDETVELMTMAPASGSRSFKQGTKIENFGEIVVLHCDSHGNSYMPLISDMCTGYDPDQIGEQTITVHYKELTTTFTVTITKATTSGTTGGSGSSGGSGGGGGGGSSSGGGGGSSSGGGGGSSSGGGPSGGSSLGGNGPSGGSTTIVTGNGGSGNSSSGSSRDTHQGANWSKRDEKWYLVKADGSYVTGWALKNGAWYYMNQGGDMKTGWLNLNNIWYYLNPDGDMKTGWLSDNGKWYYLNPAGDMKTGWLFDNGKWYFLNPSGDMATGWIMDNGKYYCLDGSGAMYANTRTPDGYFVDASGARQ